MKILFCCCVLLIGVFFVWKNNEEKRYIAQVESLFTEKVATYINKVNAVSLPGYTFDPEMYEQTPFEKKENVDEFVDGLRNAFANAVEQYIEQGGQLRREIDSDWVKQSLSLKEKIAQLFMFGLSGTEISTTERQFLQENKPGGLIVMGGNVTNQLKLLTNDIQSTNVKIPLFVGIDQEGGPVKRINENLSGQFDVAFENICSTYTDRSELLQEQGINTNFGIVADVTSNKNAFIYERTFPRKASESVAQAVACTEKTLSTIKHFPGHGMVQGDSHTGIQKTSLSCDAWKANHLPPFLSGIKNDVDLVMLGHILLPCVDANNPATLSESHVAYIRNTGYDGLLITDDMDMIATNYTWKDALEKALLAGNDIILYVDDTERRQEILNHSYSLYKQGLLTDEMIDDRLERILKKKNSIITMEEKYIGLDVYDRPRAK